MKRFSGFTLIELLTVIVLLGILSVFALGRFFGPDQFAARGFFNDTVIAVQFAQKLAIVSGCDVRVSTLVPGSGYQLRQRPNCIDPGFTIAVKNPANRSNDYQNFNIPSGFTLSAATIIFNARGTIDTGDDTIILSDGATTLSFDVYAQTGLVDVP
ncbi:MAG: type II secretion system protein [Proteobacteria bacterium]|nr:type II secretion system protein [Pseudomonadota bacterium]